MREIKFRAWCAGTHDGLTFGKPRMDYDVTIVNGKYASVEAGWDIQGTYSTVPLMQYTGLKDKNGKEIYEGDIVRTHHNSFEEIKWGQNNAARCGEEFSGYTYSIDTSKELEIIGNIYEPRVNQTVT